MFTMYSILPFTKMKNITALTYYMSKNMVLSLYHVQKLIPTYLLAYLESVTWFTKESKLPTILTGRT